MFNGVLFIAAVGLGVGLGIVYDIFVIKNYPDHRRKGAYVSAVVFFLFFSLAIYVVMSARSYANSAITSYSARMEQYVKDNYPNNEFVKNGLDFKKINNDLTQINSAVSDLRTILPSNTELGVSKTLYDKVVDYAVKALQKRLAVVNYSAKVANTFTDKNGFLTISSILYNLKTNVIKLINRIALVIMAIFGVIILIYIVSSLLTAGKERKLRNMRKANADSNVPKEA